MRSGKGGSGRGLCGLLVGCVVAAVAATSWGALSGAIFTTEVDSSGECTGVDVNLYAEKTDVYVDGGPRHTGNGTQLPDGEYYVQVTDPSGATILGSSVTNDKVDGDGDQTPVVVVDGAFENCYRLWDIVSCKTKGKWGYGYDDTPNKGGVYKVWISTTGTFENSASKTDSFKVMKKSDADPATLTIRKFYDANLNGIWDAGEVEIPGWKVYIDYPGDFDALDGEVFTPWSGQIPAPRTGAWAYTVTELFPTGLWFPTTTTSCTVDAVKGGSYSVTFGNACICEATVTMHTKGFWHNKEGSAIAADYLDGLRDLDLVDGSGEAFDPWESSFDEGEKLSDNPDDLSPWLVDGGSGDADHLRENFAQQLAAFYLNCEHYLGGGGDYYVPYEDGGFGPGGDFISAADLWPIANESLREGYDPALHELLDDLNNGYVKIYVVCTDGWKVVY